MTLGLQHAQTGTEGATDETIADPRGPLERLRAQRRHLAEKQRDHTFDHPGYHGVKVTYRRLTVEESGEILYGGASTQTAVERNLQLLVEAATRIEALEDDGTPFLTTSGYDRKFADALELDGDTARLWCLESFGGHEQPMLNHAAEVYAWMQTLRKADKDTLLGG